MISAVRRKVSYLQQSFFFFIISCCADLISVAQISSHLISVQIISASTEIISAADRDEDRDDLQR
jgi:hypothetical protein